MEMHLDSGNLDRAIDGTPWAYWVALQQSKYNFLITSLGDHPAITDIEMQSTQSIAVSASMLFKNFK
jgi:hypothetical protein